MMAKARVTPKAAIISSDLLSSICSNCHCLSVGGSPNITALRLRVYRGDARSSIVSSLDQFVVVVIFLLTW